MRLHYLADIHRAQRVLIANGFHWTLWQYLKPRQSWGVVKDVGSGEVQIHVRGFNDGRVEAEIEVSRFYLEHHRHPSVNANLNIAKILEAGGVPIIIEPSDELVRSYSVPNRLTDWRPAALIGILALALIGLQGRGRLT